MVRSSWVFLLVIVILSIAIPQILGHTCNGIIINDTNYTFDLDTNSISHGNLDLSPTVRLDPFTQTTFQLSSKFGLNDRILYTWSYVPEEEWCTGSPSLLYASGSFKYEYGSVSCTSSNSTCSDSNAYLASSYQNCDGLWNYSDPTWNIFFSAATGEVEVKQLS